MPSLSALEARAQSRDGHVVGGKIETMARTLTKEEIFELSAEERLHLIETLWDSLSPAEVPVPDSHKRLIDERIEDHRRNPDDSVSWEELEDELFPKR